MLGTTCRAVPLVEQAADAHLQTVGQLAAIPDIKPDRRRMTNAI